MTDPSVLLIQFAKWPEPGNVKTRLMPLLGREGAARAHVSLSRQVFRNLVATGFAVEFWWDRVLSSAPGMAEPILAELCAAGVRQRFQRGEDLGERMSEALASGLSTYRKVLIVGSDCPSVDPKYLASAAAALDDHDLVLGPSDDGGYVLIGARVTQTGMLAGIDWGTEQVLSQTCERLQKKGLGFHLLEPRWDVDEPSDYQRYVREILEPLSD